jgi:hypothetical protein
MIDKDKIPVIPCKECLIKPICKKRVIVGLLSISLRCSIFNEWIGRLDAQYVTPRDRLSVAKFEIAYEELSLETGPRTKVLPE